MLQHEILRNWWHTYLTWRITKIGLCVKNLSHNDHARFVQIIPQLKNVIEWMGVGFQCTYTNDSDTKTCLSFCLSVCLSVLYPYMEIGRYFSFLWKSLFKSFDKKISWKWFKNVDDVVARWSRYELTICYNTYFKELC